MLPWQFIRLLHCDIISSGNVFQMMFLENDKLFNDYYLKITPLKLYICNIFIIPGIYMHFVVYSHLG